MAAVCRTVEGREASVHLALFPDLADIVPGDESTLLEDWEQLLTIREQAMKALEEARADKIIGKGLEAAVVIDTSSMRGDPRAVIERYRDALPELFNVSSVEIVHGDPTDMCTGMLVGAKPAPGAKCERCWRFTSDVGEGRALPDRVPALRGGSGGDPFRSLCGGRGSMRGRDARAYLLLIAVLVIVLDRLSKLWMWRTCRRGI